VIHDNKVVVVGSARPFFDVVSCRWFATPTSNFGPHPDVHIAFEPVPLGSSLPCTLLNTKRTTVGIKIDMQNKQRTIKNQAIKEPYYKAKKCIGKDIIQTMKLASKYRENP
jgi:hypothetical protein